ncbi:PD-(D/E)XK nuclease domain-containing protein [Sorangium sp. So ce131]|uniref:PD-(D/E)XK nuclease domain-containing protein n=1 Tax=Sorangium sp. So ce131 TaxID=3133282 RepID=UPI003F5FC4DB
MKRLTLGRDLLMLPVAACGGDVLIRPARPGNPGVVVEIKVVGPDRAPEAALEHGLGQIRERDYAAELRAAGAAPVHAFAVAFDGKRVWVRAAPSHGAP